MGEGYLCYKTIASQNESFEAQVKIFYFTGKLCSVLKIFKFMYFSPSRDLPSLIRHDEYYTAVMAGNDFFC